MSFKYFYFLEGMNNPGGANPRFWDPSRIDEEVHRHMNRAHDRLDRELNLRFNNHVQWCQPDVRGLNLVRFYVPEFDGNRVIPNRHEAELALDWLEGHMERNNTTFSLNFVTGEGDNVCRIQYWAPNPVIPEVVGNSSVIGLFRILYFWRGTQPVNSLTLAMLSE